MEMFSTRMSVMFQVHSLNFRSSGYIGDEFLKFRLKYQGILRQKSLIVFKSKNNNNKISSIFSHCR
jgi:hypothetical protein